MTNISFGEYTIPPLSKETTATYRAFHWKKLRSLGWEVNYVEPGITEAMPEKREPGEPAEDANYSTVDDDFVSIVEEIIAHRA